MSRVQRSLPSKSNALKIPVPVITHTCVPSVTGDGDDMFCLRICLLPGAIGRFQRTLPLPRSMHQSSSCGPSATLRKMRSRQTIGVDPDQAGSGSVQARPSVFDQRTGRLVSLLTPFNSGPRHCGQLSARTWAVAHVERTMTASANSFRNKSGPLLAEILNQHKVVVLPRANEDVMVVALLAIPGEHHLCPIREKLG